jgi:hypothetical protein
MAHYMPWFEADPAGKHWGWHWTMNHYRPDQMTNGRREAASHYYPLIGLYDSNDSDALECHVLLMKLAGIDGVMIDWYGTDDYLDYSLNHRNTQRLIPWIKRAGLRFAIVYEDQTVPKLIAAHRLPEAEAVAHGQKLMQWMQDHWFTDPSYLTLDNRPVFLVFGSGYYQGDQWSRIFAGLPQQPQFFTESYRRAPAVGGFAWPQPGGGTEPSLQDLDHFYALAKDWPHFLPAAFPRFHDIYSEAGVHKSWGRIEDREGKTYEETLDRALRSKARVTQLVTWNDWGEGTMIEPSVEYGYRDLETTQRLRRKYLEPSFPFTAQDLRLPVELYSLRKRYRSDPVVHARLEEASRLLFDGHVDRARTLLKVYQNGPRVQTPLLLNPSPHCWINSVKYLFFRNPSLFFVSSCLSGEDRLF